MFDENIFICIYLNIYFFFINIIIIYQILKWNMLKLKGKIANYFGVKLQILRKMGSNLEPKKSTEVQFQPDIGFRRKGHGRENSRTS